MVVEVHKASRGQIWQRIQLALDRYALPSQGCQSGCPSGIPDSLKSKFR